MINNKNTSSPFAIMITIIFVVALFILGFVPLLAFQCGGFEFSMFISIILLVGISLIRSLFLCHDYYINKIRIASIGLIATMVSVLFSQHYWFWKKVFSFIYWFGGRVPEPVPSDEQYIVFIFLGCLIVILHLIWKK
jgi:hypothetical protein